MTTTAIEYRSGETRMIGHLATPASGTAPGILVAHAWSGCTDFERNSASKLADMGYVALAADVYGDGKTGETIEEKSALMQALLNDRAELQRRAMAAVEVLRQHSGVDSARIAGIGYCFGGLTVLDLARAGADLRSVVSFHGALAPPQGIPNQAMKAAVLVLNGADDPMVPAETLADFQQEMDESGAVWEIVNYGGAQHSFTNPSANNKELGMLYNERIANRSWRAMGDFLEETLA